jgi:eukaryotic-like serine/threonine-protein kinase
MNAALWEAEIGDARRAIRQSASSLSLVDTRDLRMQATVVLASAGESKEAAKMASELARDSPVDTLLINYWVPVTRATIEPTRNDPPKAIEYLRSATPFELSMNAPMVPIYLRGKALLRMNQGTEAVVQFQRFLDHRGQAGNHPFAAVAHLQVARGYAMQGDTAKAKAAYQDFLTLWKDADADIPILIAAKAEYAKLQ